MGKPIVFFSHSSKNADALARLKTQFVELTGGAIEAFLSSDGQSIRFGKNWVSSIEDALKEASENEERAALRIEREPPHHERERVERATHVLRLRAHEDPNAARDHRDVPSA